MSFNFTYKWNGNSYDNYSDYADAVSTNFDAQAESLANLANKDLLSTASIKNTEGTGNVAKTKPAFADSKLGKGLGMAGKALSSFYDIIPSTLKPANSNDAIHKQINGTVAKGLLSSGNPWAMAVGGGITLFDKTGGFSGASKGLGKSTDTLNAIASHIGGLGYFAGKTDDFEISKQILNSGAFGEVAHSGTIAKDNSNVNLVFGRGKANRLIRKTNNWLLKGEDILNEGNDVILAGSSPLLPYKTSVRNSGGYQQISSKLGSKLSKENVNWAKNILNNLPKNKETQIESFKNGGEFNVIPEGALHKNRHHLEEIDEKFEDVTSKGIPIISENSEGNIVLHAEVEKEEIIFRLEVTKKLEELSKLDTDEAAIEAGKLLTKEILYNTKDETKKLI